MIRDRGIGGRLVQGLRTKYFPRTRINQGLISIGPWINMVLLLFMFLFLSQRVVVQRGYTVNLPRVGSVSGEGLGLVAVVRHFDVSSGGGVSDRLFFNDESFVPGHEVQTKLLRQRLREEMARTGKSAVTVYVDRDVATETLSMLFEVFQSAGVESVSIAVDGK